MILILHICVFCFVFMWFLLKSLLRLHWSQTTDSTRSYVTHTSNTRKSASYSANPWPLPQSEKSSVCTSISILPLFDPVLWSDMASATVILALWLLVGFQLTGRGTEWPEVVCFCGSLPQTWSLLVGCIICAARNSLHSTPLSSGSSRTDPFPTFFRLRSNAASLYCHLGFPSLWPQLGKSLRY